jgi:hypothetical protein
VKIANINMKIARQVVLIDGWWIIFGKGWTGEHELAVRFFTGRRKNTETFPVLKGIIGKHPNITMNAKLIISLSCFAAVTLTASLVNADPRGGGGGRGGGHIMSMPARGGATFSRGTSGTSRNWNGGNWNGGNWNGGNWSGRNWSGGNWNRNWNNHHHNNSDVIFIGDFGFPFWGWGWGYPYGYYGGYGYGYPYGYGYGYGYDYYSQPAYGYGYGNQGYGYGNQGYGYGNSQPGYRYGNGNGNGSSVVQLQRRLARAGYYHGAIDGIMGPETRRAIRAYERSYNVRQYGMIDRY